MALNLRDRLLFVLLVTLAACSSSSSSRPAPTSAVSAPAAPSAAQPSTQRRLEDKRFDEVVFATTHNAYNYEGAFLFPNQDHAISRQLQDGVRALMLDVHPYSGSDPAERGRPYLYHSTALLGSQPLSVALEAVRDFLDADRRAIVTLILECYVGFPELEQALFDAGLDRYFHVQDPAAPWPTLAEMASAGGRLVVFNDRRDSGKQYSWSHYLWDFAVETAFSNHELSDFSSAFNRGDPAHALFILNHFLTFPPLGIGDRSRSQQANSNPLLRDRVTQVMRETGKIPNFLTVDFHDIGDVFEVVGELNTRIP